MDINPIMSIEKSFAVNDLDQIIASQGNERQQAKSGNQLEDTEVKSYSKRKRTIFLIISLSVLLVLALGITLGVKRCEFFNLDQCAAITPIQTVIVSRPFKSSQCYVVDYTKLTEMSIGGSLTGTIRTNQTLYYCVKGVSSDQSLSMLGYYKKISEQDMSQNPPLVTYFDNQAGLQSSLYAQTGSSSGTTVDTFTITGVEGTSNVAIDATLNKNTINQIIMFDFTVSQKGELTKLTVNTQSDNSTLAELPKLIKLFFPKLDISLYQPSTQRRLQSSNGQAYTYSKDPQGTELNSNIVLPASTNDDVQASHELTSSSIFDKDGLLTQGSMSGTSQITSTPSPQLSSVNLPTQISIAQSIGFTVSNVMNNLTSTHVQEFGSVLADVVSTNKVKTFTSEQQFSDYTMGKQANQKTPTPSVSSIARDNLVLQSHSIRLLSSNIFGMPLLIEGNVFLQVNLTQLAQYIYQPSFKSSSNITLILGPHRESFSLYEFGQSFNTLSLGFTQQKIKGLISFFEKDFINLIKTIQNLASSVTFQNDIQPALVSVLTQMSKGVQLMNQAQLSLIPATLTSGVSTNLAGVIQGISSISPLIDQKILLVQTIETQLYAFANQTYVSNLVLLKQVQQQLKLTPATVSQMLNEIKANFSSLIQQYVAPLVQSVGQQLEAIYLAELQKAKPFFDLHEYIATASVTVSEGLKLSVAAHKAEFQKATKAFLELYYSKYTQSLPQISNYITAKGASLDATITIVKDKVNQAKTVSENFLQAALLQINNLVASLPLSTLSPAFEQTLSNIKSQATLISTEYPAACSSKGQKWWANSCESTEFQTASLFISSLPLLISDLQLKYLNFKAQVSSVKPFLQKVNLQLQSSNIINVLLSHQSELAAAYSFISEVVKSSQSLLTLKDNLASSANLIATTSCCPSCCEFSLNTQAAIARITTIGNQIDGFVGVIKSYASFGEIQKYLGAVKVFEQIPFGDIINFFASGKDLSVFYQPEIDRIVGLVTFISSIPQIKDRITSDFLAGKLVAPTIINTFVELSTQANAFCSLQRVQLTTMVQYYNQYYPKIEPIIQSSPILQQGFAFLSQAYNSIIATGLTNDILTVCDQSVLSVITQISNAASDANFIKNVQSAMINFGSYIAQTQTRLASIDSTIASLNQFAGKAYNNQLFMGLIQADQALAITVKTLATQFSSNMTFIKNVLRTLEQLPVLGSDIALIVTPFVDSKITVNFYDLFSQETIMRTSALGSLSGLNYEVFFAFVIVSSQRDLLLNFENIVKNQLANLEGTINGIINNINNLGIDLTIDYLVQIQKEYNNLKAWIPAKIGQIVQAKVDAYNTQFQILIQEISKYSGVLPLASQQMLMQAFNITSDKILKLIADCAIAFAQGHQIALQSLSFYQAEFEKFIVDNAKVIQSIKAGVLTTISDIGSFSVQTLTDLKVVYMTEVKKLVDLAAAIPQNPSLILQISTTINGVKTNIQTTYDSAISSIDSRLSTYLTMIQADPILYAAFVNTQAYTKLVGLKSLLQIDLLVVWSQVKVNSDALLLLEQSIDPSKIQIIQALTTLAVDFTNVYSNMQTRINAVIGAFSNIDAFFAQVKSLVFNSLKADTIAVIQGSLKVINNEVNQFMADFTTIDRLCSLQLPPEYAAITAYLQTIKTAKDSIVSGPLITIITNLQKDFGVISSFLNNELTNKIDILVYASSILSSIANSPNPIDQTNLFNQTLINRQLMAKTLKFVYPSPVGIFSYEFYLNLTITGKISIDLIKLRTIQASLALQSLLQISAEFSQGSSGTKDLGAYVKGQIMSTTITPTFQMYNIIPLQLIPGLKDIVQFNLDNNFALKLMVDLQTNPLSFEAGGIATYYLQTVTWLKVNYCPKSKSSLKKIQVCSSLRVPSRVYQPQVQKYGQYITISPIAKKRIVDLVLYQHQY